MSSTIGNVFNGDTFTPITIYNSTASLQAVDLTTGYQDGYRAAVADGGVYQWSKQAISGTLAATPMGYWNIQSSSVPYLLLSSSNEIDGSQVGSIGLASLANGTVGTPSLNFTNSTGSGLYLIGTNNVGFAINGVKTLDWSTTAITAALPVVHAVGTVSAPGIAFASDLDTGLYWISANRLGLATNGVLAMDWSTTAITSALPVVLPVGSAGAPSLTFTGDIDTGLYRPSSHDVGITCHGATTCIINETGINLSSGLVLLVNSVQVVRGRDTGWTTFAGTGTKNQSAINVDTFTATDANIRLLGQGVKGILDALILHGLLGA